MFENQTFMLPKTRQSGAYCKLAAQLYIDREGKNTFTGELLAKRVVKIIQ